MHLHSLYMMPLERDTSPQLGKIELNLAIVLNILDISPTYILQMRMRPNTPGDHPVCIQSTVSYAALDSDQVREFSEPRCPPRTYILVS